MTVKSIAFTMYPVKDIVRARRFYEQDLGLTAARIFQDAWIEYDIDGQTFAITTLAEGINPSSTAGGGSGGPCNNGQNINSLLGKLFRLDPATGNACTNGIDNPFAAGGGAAEIWSLGLRNPWRFSFDRQTGELYVMTQGGGQFRIVPN